VNQTAYIAIEPGSVVIDRRTARALYRLIDNVSLVRLIRDDRLTPENVRDLMDYWAALDKAVQAGAME